MKLEIVRHSVATATDFEIEVLDVIGISFREKKIRYISKENPKEVTVLDIDENSDLFIYEN